MEQRRSIIRKIEFRFVCSARMRLMPTRLTFRRLGWIDRVLVDMV
jgi:hypothetical protein